MHVKQAIALERCCGGTHRMQDLQEFVNMIIQQVS
jgi:hypothetical protein